MLAGRVGRPHGLDGSFHVMDAVPDVLTPGLSVRVGESDTEVVATKGTAENPIVRVGLASDRTAIEALRGADLVVDPSFAPELGEDEYLADDLLGATVVDGDRELGTVTSLMALPSCEALELDTGLLVPMVRDAIRSVDVEIGRAHV